MRLITSMTLVAMMVAPVLAGCGAGTEATAGDADPAAQLLALAPTPPGAVAVDTLPGKAFREPATRPQCEPLDIRTAYWTTASTGPAVMEFVTAHPGSQLQLDGSGSGTDRGVATSWQVMLTRRGESSGKLSGRQIRSTLVYQIAPLPAGVGIRVDAEVVPADASCTFN